MPKFTQPHSISSPLPEELIKSVSFESKLASDFQALAESAGLAITAEGIRAEGAATGTAATDATAKVNAAKTDAITTAATDATAKVNAAQSASAADATSKANAAVAASKVYTDQVVDTSHLARDVDGTPYFSPGSMTLRVFTDTDGVPFFLDA